MTQSENLLDGHILAITSIQALVSWTYADIGNRWGIFGIPPWPKIFGKYPL